VRWYVPARHHRLPPPPWSSGCLRTVDERELVGRLGLVAAVRSGPGEPEDDGVADEDSESDRDEGDGGVDEVIEPGRAIGADELGDADQADRAGTSSQNAGRKVASGGGPDGRVATQAATGVTIRPPQNPPSGSENSWAPSCWPR
jgi:hypothetical protein